MNKKNIFGKMLSGWCVVSLLAFHSICVHPSPSMKRPDVIATQRKNKKFSTSSFTRITKRTPKKGTQRSNGRPQQATKRRKKRNGVWVLHSTTPCFRFITPSSSQRSLMKRHNTTDMMNNRQDSRLMSGKIIATVPFRSISFRLSLGDRE